jgi:hypothetical protein
MDLERRIFMVSRIRKEGKQISGNKLFFLALLVWMPLFGVFGQENPLDLVVILDTSSSMSGSYQKTIDYITGGFLKEFLRIGDTFHLISFSDSPRLEITRRISGWGDVETVIGRLFLLYPLEPYSDISGALAYGERYVTSIPGTRKKKVVFISDGDHNPQQGGGAEDPIQNLISQTTTRLNQAGIDFYYVSVPVTGNGPSSGRSRMPPRQTIPQAPPAADRATAPEPAARPAQTPSPPADRAADQAQIPETRSAQQSAPPPAEQATVPDVPPPPPQADRTPAPAPESPPPGEPEAASPPVKAPAQETSPAAPRRQAGELSLFGLPLFWFIGGILGVILILALVIFLMLKRLQTSPNRTFAHAADPPPAKKPVPPKEPETTKNDREPSKEKIPALYPAAPAGKEANIAPGRPVENPETSPGASGSDRTLIAPAGFVPPREAAGTPAPSSGPGVPPNTEGAPMAPGRPDNNGGYRRISPLPSYKNNTQTDTGPLMLSLFVEDQNTHIGRRNIHTVKPGYSFTIGGGKSDFLIFLVPIPPGIAELRSDGSQCTFIPRKPEFFPDLGSRQVPNCVGIPIRIISERHYELFIRIDRYEDPLVALNRLLHSVDVPGYWQP